jgi:hypothetical protein
MIAALKTAVRAPLLAVAWAIRSADCRCGTPTELSPLEPNGLLDVGVQTVVHGAAEGGCF